MKSAPFLCDTSANSSNQATPPHTHTDPLSARVSHKLIVVPGPKYEPSYIMRAALVMQRQVKMYSRQKHVGLCLCVWPRGVRGRSKQENILLLDVRTWADGNQKEQKSEGHVAAEPNFSSHQQGDEGQRRAGTPTRRWELMVCALATRCTTWTPPTEVQNSPLSGRQQKQTFYRTNTFAAPAVSRLSSLTWFRKGDMREDLIMQPLEVRGESSASNTLLPPPLFISYTIHL